MNESEKAQELGALKARVSELEKLAPRVAGLEKALWGFGGAVAIIAYMFGIFSDWIKDKLGVGS